MDSGQIKLKFNMQACRKRTNMYQDLFNQITGNNCPQTGSLIPIILFQLMFLS
jgi:hypothetical protein